MIDQDMALNETTALYKAADLCLMHTRRRSQQRQWTLRRKQAVVDVMEGMEEAMVEIGPCYNKIDKGLRKGC